MGGVYYDFEDLEIVHPKCFLTTCTLGIFFELGLLIYYL
jgi:hypothetical protein